MPIFVQWKWEERTETFLVIFHFFDDFSERNVRMKTTRIDKIHLYPAEQTYTEEHLSKPVISWSPSHPELALFSELLSYANLINGLKPQEKIKLKSELEGEQIIKWIQSGYPKTYYSSLFRTSIHVIVGVMTGHNKKSYLCFELSYGYIEYQGNSETILQVNFSVVNKEKKECGKLALE